MPQLPLFGARVDSIGVSEVHQMVLDGLGAERPPRPTVLGNLNLHGLYLYETDEVFRLFVDRADVVLIDGWPVWALARLRKKLPRSTRIGSTDWLFPLIERLPVGTRVVAVGGTPEVAAAARERATLINTNIDWRAYDGFDLNGIASAAELTHFDLMLVGMGMPRQERWILENAEFLDGRFVANVGGCLDYLAGAQPLAPRWLGPIGMEWAYRLVRDPKRLAHRYLVEPLLLADHLARRRRRVQPVVDVDTH